MIIGIDACNIRQGGGLTHLIELLNESNPVKHNFSKIIIWSSTNTLSNLPNHYWIEKKSHCLLEKNFIFSFIFQMFFLKKQLKMNYCKIVFVPGSTFLSNFRPYVTLSQNLLPFELKEAFRYKSHLKRIKFLMLRVTQSYTFRNATGLIFLTDYAKYVICRKVKVSDNNIIIPHGINDSFLKTPKLQKSINSYNNENPFKLLYVSILSPYKHQWNIAQAVCNLYTQGVPLKLILVGPSEIESYEKLKKVLDINKVSDYCIEYHGGINHKDLFGYYKNADSFIYGSTCENLPIILIEAMSSGLPILSSSYGPMKEILKDNANMYFNPLNIYDIEDKIKFFLYNHDIRTNISKKSFELALNFTWSQMADNTFYYLQQVSNKYYNEYRE
jgi:glycosyltransferase involved in cell wall biosynthesis